LNARSIAVAHDVDETVQSELDKYPTEIFSQIEVAGGRAWIKPEGVRYFAGGLSKQEQKLVWATHYPPAVHIVSCPIFDCRRRDGKSLFCR
jgi:hypothetical protein